MLFIYREDGIVETLPPRVLGMPAKTLMFILLVFDALTLIIFSFNLSGFILVIFIFLILIDIVSCLFYIKSCIRPILVHMFYCVGYIISVAITLFFVKSNTLICTDVGICKPVNDHIESIYVAYFNTHWFYFFVVSTIILHAAVCVLSFKVLKYLAARKELEKLPISRPLQSMDSSQA